MTLPQQLRAIADRIEAGESAVLAAQAELWKIAGALPGEVVDLAADSASAQGAVEDAAGEGHASPPVASAAAPIEQPAAVVRVIPESPPAQGVDGAKAARAGKRAGGVGEAPTPVVHAGDAGSTPASRSIHAPEQVAAGNGATAQLKETPAPAVPRGTMRPCPNCGKEFDTGQGLSLHRRRTHAYKPWEPVPMGTSSPAAVIRKGAEWFVCARCPLKFPTREARDRHQLTHPPIPEPGPLRSIGRGGGLGE